MKKQRFNIYDLKSICLFLIGFVVFQGCKKDWLDQKPDQSLAVPSTIKDFEAMLDFFSTNNVGVFATSEVASDGHYVTEASWSLVTGFQKSAYTWSMENGSYIAVNDWNQCYRLVLIANMILEGVKKIKPNGGIELENLNRIKGQAFFLRGRLFYEIAQTFAPAYNSQTANTDMGIPLRLESDVTIASRRSTVQQTYDQIISDLTVARELLPITGAFKSRASKNATNAILARVYLNMEEYTNAFKNADASLQINNALLNYSNLNTNTTFIGNYLTNPEIIFHEFGFSESFINSRCLIDPEFYNSYSNNDLRRTIYFRVASGNISFKGNYNNSTTLLFFGPANDEMYLIRAECHARAGRTIEAMKDLNDLLRTRWTKVAGVSTYVDQTAASPDEALVKVLIERRKELIMRGQRWGDLRRLNKDDRFKVTLSRTIGGKTYTLEPNSYKYTFPIPDDVIQQSGMPQNPGWE